ncbi:MAG: N-acetylneuraminate synthase family protein [Desulfobacteraceae bacterium]|nr:N-acetylneuraminate synthase family protein [Desulfobacteraceae bacterium]
MQPVQIKDHIIGPGHPTFITAEIGINHNGDLKLAKKLISAAAASGCDAVKFQKRTIEVVYTPEELVQPRESPFGTTNGDLKRGLEFGKDEYAEIDRFCRSLDMMWFTSCWDEGSVDFIEQYAPPCYKIASACLTNDNLLRYHKSLGRPIILSTGMSTMEQIDHAVEILGHENLILMHCISTYPAKIEELNLKVIPRLIERYDIPVGYSGHEVGLYTTLAAVVLEACAVERHITLDRAIWGSDQAASVEPHGIARLVKDIRAVETAMGDGVKRVYESEIPVMRKLRKVGI